MRAVVYDRFSDDFDDLEIREVPDPKVQPGCVVVEVRAAGVNPVDWKLMAGMLDAIIPTQFPVIPGWDVSGVVVAVGADTPEFAIGDEVFAYARKDVLGEGTFAELACIPARAAAHKPAGLSWEAAAALPLAGGTALRALDSLGDIDGKTVLIYGGAGGVGGLAVQIARAAGARVITTASERNYEFLRGLGVEPVVYGEGLAERVLRISGGPVDAVADFVGDQLETTLAVLREGAPHASIADRTVVDHGGRSVWVRPDGAETARLGALAAAGKLVVDIAGTYGLEEVADAFRASATGHTRGKLVIVPGE